MLCWRSLCCGVPSAQFPCRFRFHSALTIERFDALKLWLEHEIDASYMTPNLYTNSSPRLCLTLIPQKKHTRLIFVAWNQKLHPILIGLHVSWAQFPITMSEDSQPAVKKHKRVISLETTTILQSSLTQMRSVIASLTSNAELADIVDTEPIEELSRTLATKLQGRMVSSYHRIRTTQRFRHSFLELWLQRLGWKHPAKPPCHGSRPVPSAWFRAHARPDQRFGQPRQGPYLVIRHVVQSSQHA